MVKFSLGSSRPVCNRRVFVVAFVIGVLIPLVCVVAALYGEQSIVSLREVIRSRLRNGAIACESSRSAQTLAHVPAGPSWLQGPFVNDTGYAPALPEHWLRKGIVSYGDARRMRRVVGKLLRGEAVTVAVVGGSISWGQGAHQVGIDDYASRIFTWITGTFPHANHTLINGAVPGTPSSYMALCYKWHIPETADLVVVEYNVNDGGDKWDGPMRRSHERLLRKMMQLPPCSDGGGGHAVAIGVRNAAGAAVPVPRR